MTFILVEGPDPDRRHRLCAELKLNGAMVRHFPEQPEPDDRVYGDLLKDDLQYHDVVVWDRAWPSDCLELEGRLTNNPWVGEWIHGRALKATGLGVILLSITAPTNPFFLQYGRRFGYLMFETSVPEALSRDLITLARERVATPHPVPFPNWAGPVNAPVVFVGDKRSKNKTTPGSYLPFTSRLCTQLGLEFGDAALQCGWVNAAECPPQVLKNRQLLVACGANAERWIRYHVPEGGTYEVVRLDHPAYIYRWNKADHHGRLTAHRQKLSHIMQRIQEIQETSHVKATQ